MLNQIAAIFDSNTLEENTLPTPMPVQSPSAPASSVEPTLKQLFMDAMADSPLAEYRCLQNKRNPDTDEIEQESEITEPKKKKVKRAPSSDAEETAEEPTDVVSNKYDSSEWQALSFTPSATIISVAQIYPILHQKTEEITKQIKTSSLSQNLKSWSQVYPYLITQILSQSATILGALPKYAISLDYRQFYTGIQVINAWENILTQWQQYFKKRQDQDQELSKYWTELAPFYQANKGQFDEIQGFMDRLQPKDFKPLRDQVSPNDRAYFLDGQTIMRAVSAWFWKVIANLKTIRTVLLRVLALAEKNSKTDSPFKEISQSDMQVLQKVLTQSQQLIQRLRDFAQKPWSAVYARDMDYNQTFNAQQDGYLIEWAKKNEMKNDGGDPENFTKGEHNHLFWLEKPYMEDPTSFPSGTPETIIHRYLHDLLLTRIRDSYIGTINTIITTISKAKKEFAKQAEIKQIDSAIQQILHFIANVTFSEQKFGITSKTQKQSKNPTFEMVDFQKRFGNPFGKFEPDRMGLHRIVSILRARYDVAKFTKKIIEHLAPLTGVATPETLPSMRAVRWSDFKRWYYIPYNHHAGSIIKNWKSAQTHDVEPEPAKAPIDQINPAALDKLTDVQLQQLCRHPHVYLDGTPLKLAQNEKQNFLVMCQWITRKNKDPHQNLRIRIQNLLSWIRAFCDYFEIEVRTPEEIQFCKEILSSVKKNYLKAAQSVIGDLQFKENSSSEDEDEEETINHFTSEMQAFLSKIDKKSYEISALSVSNKDEKTRLKPLLKTFMKHLHYLTKSNRFTRHSNLETFARFLYYTINLDPCYFESVPAVKFDRNSRYAVVRVEKSADSTNSQPKSTHFAYYILYFLYSSHQTNNRVLILAIQISPGSYFHAMWERFFIALYQDQQQTKKFVFDDFNSYRYSPYCEFAEFNRLYKANKALMDLYLEPHANILNFPLSFFLPVKETALKQQKNEQFIPHFSPQAIKNFRERLSIIDQYLKTQSDPKSDALFQEQIEEFATLKAACISQYEDLQKALLKKKRTFAITQKKGKKSAPKPADSELKEDQEDRENKKEENSQDLPKTNLESDQEPNILDAQIEVLNQFSLPYSELIELLYTIGSKNTPEKSDRPENNISEVIFHNTLISLITETKHPHEITLFEIKAGLERFSTKLLNILHLYLVLWQLTESPTFKEFANQYAAIFGKISQDRSPQVEQTFLQQMQSQNIDTFLTTMIDLLCNNPNFKHIKTKGFANELRNLYIQIIQVYTKFAYGSTPNPFATLKAYPLLGIDMDGSIRIRYPWSFLALCVRNYQPALSRFGNDLGVNSAQTLNCVHLTEQGDFEFAYMPNELKEDVSFAMLPKRSFRQIIQSKQIHITTIEAQLHDLYSIKESVYESLIQQTLTKSKDAEWNNARRDRLCNSLVKKSNISKTPKSRIKTWSRQDIRISTQQNRRSLINRQVIHGLAKNTVEYIEALHSVYLDKYKTTNEVALGKIMNYAFQKQYDPAHWTIILNALTEASLNPNDQISLIGLNVLCRIMMENLRHFTLTGSGPFARERSNWLRSLGKSITEIGEYRGIYVNTYVPPAYTSKLSHITHREGKKGFIVQYEQKGDTITFQRLEFPFSEPKQIDFSIPPISSYLKEKNPIRINHIPKDWKWITPKWLPESVKNRILQQSEKSPFWISSESGNLFLFEDISNQSYYIHHRDKNAACYLAIYNVLMGNYDIIGLLGNRLDLDWPKPSKLRTQMRNRMNFVLETFQSAEKYTKENDTTLISKFMSVKGLSQQILVGFKEQIGKNLLYSISKPITTAIKKKQWTTLDWIHHMQKLLDQAQNALSTGNDMNEDMKIQYSGKIAEFQPIFRSLYWVYRITSQINQIMKENPSMYGQAAPIYVQNYAKMLVDAIKELNPEVKFDKFG